jgi:diaminohydroxyphosphoribosylaminopyrimidine deaminase/5-amino-6-(5-phosphoribosylamino)uracil reductase
MSEPDTQYLRRAIRLAMNGRGSTEPNPSVGCVIVKNDCVIGEGFTQPFGGPHAEPTALASCDESPVGAIAYVTMEPCCHLNKKTPPCAPRLIAAKIARVVVGCLDPNPDVDGKGIVMLRNAGITVDRAEGELENESRQLIAPFIARTVHHRPYITLKWAQTADGKIAGGIGARLQISNAAATRAVHQLRSRCDAIVVGVNTVIADDPLLTARDVEAPRPLRRMILDSHLRTPPTARLATEGVDLFYTERGFLNGLDRIKQLMPTGVNLCMAPSHQGDPRGRVSIAKWVLDKSLNDVTHLLVEPGPTLARSFFDAGASDRVWIIRSPRKLDAPAAPSAAALPSRFVQTGEIDLNGDLLCEYLDTESDLFLAPVKSADFVLMENLVPSPGTPGEG